PGFGISVFAEGVKGARSMALGDKGTLFVGTIGEGNVYAIANDGTKATKIETIASGLEMPNGVAVKDGALYVAEVDRVWRYDAIESRLPRPPKPALVYDRYPRDRHHGWKFIRFGPDGWLYAQVGAPCNICASPDPYASITRLKPDGSAMEVFARGVRNSVGFDWDPRTGELWFTDNGRDMMGDDMPSDELDHAPMPGMHFGFPYCHQGDTPDPELAKGHACSEFTPPVAKLGAHVAALGMRFYAGSMFPAEYRGRIFIAEHGSWNRSKKSGYRVVTARIEDGKAVDLQTFAEGWLDVAKDEAWGRPVDVQVMPDGALLVSDDASGAIYRISYRK
ncbi:MAG TPA: PQQ-dependent sugar dehydrogenase, partial [Usitatibacter sp.]|nr:PQQ-dependent sugar dehydrogenase [Usitatibacter sp.]